MDNIIVTNSLTKVYGEGANAVTALHPLSIKIKVGSINVIMGKSGSGKTTLLHLLAGIDVPTGGNVSYRGQSIYQLKDADIAQIRGNKFGFIFQFFHLVPSMTVYDNITLPLIFTKQKIDTYKVKQLADRLGILNKLGTSPDMLSGGEQQRVAIARSMINSPEIIFADEPTGNLDQSNTDNVVELLVNLCKDDGLTLILVTHDQNLIPDPDYKYWMENGELRAL
ncbi:ABC transporter ATP-binding protein [Paenibacillus sp. UMB4589-SE434]|uniref:ABC transporter ATP-binding protein n=1 Tax=Paenibacillus sp. UMB4589-SE434 TaxID=3046314 RepID=UPI00254A6ED4|nr:ABC transporter ATP-binding protein [Paenibacillus sp. UMB4589-SE434]MDK8182593.1 ABC transporter ATP-binding protein [Paenibacillus sp. UMB4589-SE434]